MAIENNENWIKFIKKYKNLSELWDIRNEKYKNKAIRANAYEILTKQYQNIDETATVETVKKRIKNMRSAYKRELRKKIASERSGADVNEVYEPNLWYFNAFEFLKDLVMPEGETSAVLSSDDESVKKSPIKNAKRKKSFENNDRNELLRKAAMHMEKLSQMKEKDEADIYGEGWAHSYRKLSALQKIFAKKACDEIFVLGQLGKLTLNSVRTETSPYPSALSLRSSHIEQDYDGDFDFDSELKTDNKIIEEREEITPSNDDVNSMPDESNDPLDGEMYIKQKRLEESSIKIENVECSPNLNSFDNSNNSEYEPVESDRNTSEDPNSLYQSSITNNQEGSNAKFLKLNDLNDFRNEFKDDLNKTEMRITNQIREQPETIKRILVRVLEQLKLVKPDETIKLIPKTNIIPKQPFSTIKDFLQFEADIQNDEEKYNQLVYYFEQQNASCFPNYVKLIWRKLISDGAAQHMCWKGTEKKTPVRSLTITQALKAACLKKYYREVDLHFEKICILHFQHAKGRHEKKLNYKSRVKTTA